MPNAAVEFALWGIDAPRTRFSPLALFLLMCVHAVKRVIPPHSDRTLKIRLASYHFHPAIGRDAQFNLVRIAQVIDELDADALALQEVAPGGQSWVDPRTALQSSAARTSAMVWVAAEHLPIVARFQFGTVARTGAPVHRMATAG